MSTDALKRVLYYKDEGFIKKQNYNGALDLRLGGRGGYAPVLAEFINNQAYIRKPLIPILLQYPKFFDLMPNPNIWIETLKAIVELHPKSIDGFNAGLQVDTDTHPVGGGGELQHEVVNVKRQPSEPSFTYVEKYGMPIKTFFYYWITYGLQDPDTKFALVNTLDSNNIKNFDLTAEQYSMTMLFIEPDPTHTKVLKSWVTTNMFPIDSLDIIGKRDLPAGSELDEFSIKFSGISQFSLGTNSFAQSILEASQKNLVNSNPYYRKSFLNGKDANITDTSNGYETNIEKLHSNIV